MKNHRVLLFVLLSINCSLPMDAMATYPGDSLKWLSSWLSHAHIRIPEQYRPSYRTVVAGLVGAGLLVGGYSLWARSGWQKWFMNRGTGSESVRASAGTSGPDVSVEPRVFEVKSLNLGSTQGQEPPKEPSDRAQEKSVSAVGSPQVIQAEQDQAIGSSDLTRGEPLSISADKTSLKKEKEDDKGEEVESITSKPFEDIPYSWAVAETQGKRNEMEDAHTLVYASPYLVAGIYDGHGGVFTAHLLANGSQELAIKPLHDVILNRLRSSPNVSVENVLKASFVDTDQQLYNALYDEKDSLKNQQWHSGSTAVVAVVNVISRECYFAWAGDSRALLVNEQGEIEGQTDDHSLDDEIEVKRIEGAGAQIFNNWGVRRISGVLNVARSFGDFWLGGYRDEKGKAIAKVVSAQPSIKKFSLSSGRSYKLFLGCDGVFAGRKGEALTNKRVAQIVAGKESDFKDQSKYLVDEQNNNIALGRAVNQGIISKALQYGSTDNISAMVVDLGSFAQK